MHNEARFDIDRVATPAANEIHRAVCIVYYVRSKLR
jgi:hypothetical protein